MRNANKGGFFQDLKVLVVEDDKVILYATEALIKHKHPTFVIDKAETGKEALAKICEQSYDVILLDLGLPDIAGQDVASYARYDQLSLCNNAELIILSAHQPDLEHRPDLKKIAKDIIMKPLTLDLIDQIFCPA